MADEMVRFHWDLVCCWANRSLTFVCVYASYLVKRSMCVLPYFHLLVSFSVFAALKMYQDLCRALWLVSTPSDRATIEACPHINAVDSIKTFELVARIMRGRMILRLRAMLIQAPKTTFTRSATGEQNDKRHTLNTHWIYEPKWTTGEQNKRTYDLFTINFFLISPNPSPSTSIEQQ